MNFELNGLFLRLGEKMPSARPQMVNWPITVLQNCQIICARHIETYYADCLCRSVRTKESLLAQNGLSNATQFPWHFRSYYTQL